MYAIIVKKGKNGDIRDVYYGFDRINLKFIICLIKNLIKKEGKIKIIKI